MNDTNETEWEARERVGEVPFNTPPHGEADLNTLHEEHFEEAYELGKQHGTLLTLSQLESRVWKEMPEPIQFDFDKYSNENVEYERGKHNGRVEALSEVLHLIAKKRGKDML